MAIIKRDVFTKILPSLENEDIIILTGPRQAGKSVLLRGIFDHLVALGKRAHIFTLEEPNTRELLDLHPYNLEKIVTLPERERIFILIDEIQYLKRPTNFLKLWYDTKRDHVKLIVTGSSAFYLDTRFKDSLVGRKKIFEVHTLSFREYMRFQGKESAFADLGKTPLAALRELETGYHEYLRFGGYPRVALTRNETERQELLQDIATSYVKRDILESGARNETLSFKLLSILAEDVGSLLNVTELGRRLGVTRPTIERALYVMHKSYHIHLAKPFAGGLRQELSKMPKPYFHDLGLRNYFAGALQPFVTRPDKGVIFENGVYRTLLDLYSEDAISYWRDKQKHEVDFIVDRRFAFEAKNVRGRATTSSRYFHRQYPAIPLRFVTISGDEGSMRPWQIVL